MTSPSLVECSTICNALLFIDVKFIGLPTVNYYVLLHPFMSYYCEYSISKASD